MRLVILAGYDGPYAGSFIPMVRSTLTAARERGWEPEAVFTATARDRPWLADFEADSLPVRVVPRFGRGPHLREARTVAAGAGPVILHSVFTAFDVGVALCSSRANRRIALWHMQSRAEPATAARLRNRLKYSVLGRRVSRVLCVAPDVADAVVSRGADAAKVMTVPNAVAVDRFHPPDSRRREESRARLGIDPDAKVLLHFGWDWHRKGGDLLLEALRRLRADDGARVVAVSVGADAEATDLARAIGVGDALRTVEPVGDVAELHAAADVFVSPSRAEGMPFAVAEALASGLPVVASSIPGHRMIGSDVDACRLTGLDPQELAAAVREVIATDGERLAIEGRDARRSVAQRLGLGAWVDRMLGIYDEVLAEKR